MAQQFWTRRHVLAGLAASASVLAMPGLVRPGRAQGADLGPYQSAKIDWRQADGESITVAVIPAGYFENLIALAPSSPS